MIISTCRLQHLKNYFPHFFTIVTSIIVLYIFERAFFILTINDLYFIFVVVLFVVFFIIPLRDEKAVLGMMFQVKSVGHNLQGE